MTYERPTVETYGRVGRITEVPIDDNYGQPKAE